MNLKKLTLDNFINLCQLYSKKKNISLLMAQEELAKKLKFSSYSDAIEKLTPTLDELLKSVPPNFKEEETDWGVDVGREKWLQRAFETYDNENLWEDLINEDFK